MVGGLAGAAAGFGAPGTGPSFVEVLGEGGLAPGWVPASFSASVDFDFPLASAAGALTTSELPPELAGPRPVGTLVATEPWGALRVEEPSGSGALAEADKVTFWLWVAPQPGRGGGPGDSSPQLHFRLEAGDGAELYDAVALGGDEVPGGLAWDTWQAVTVDLSDFPSRDWRRLALQDVSEEGTVFIVDHLRLWSAGASALGAEKAMEAEAGAEVGAEAGAGAGAGAEAESSAEGAEGSAVLASASSGEGLSQEASVATRPMVLIDEVGLGEGVVDWSWNASYLLYEPPDGVTAAVDGWGALSVKTETPFSTDWWGASALEMWVSVVDPDVPLAIRLDASDSETSLDAFTISFDEVLKGTQLKPMQWTQLVVPLESLGPHQWDRVSLVVAEDDAQDVLIRVKRLALLPSKYFESRSGSSTISWVLDDGDSTVPLYSEDLYSGVTDWSWGADVDFAFPLGDASEPQAAEEAAEATVGEVAEEAAEEAAEETAEDAPAVPRGILVDTVPYGALSLRTKTPFHHGLAAERDSLEIEFWLYLDDPDQDQALGDVPPPVEAYEGRPGRGATLHLRLDAVNEAAGNSSQIMATLPLDQSLNGNGDAKGEALPRGEWVHFQVPVAQFGNEAWDRISWVDNTGKGVRFVVDGVNLIHRRT